VDKPPSSPPCSDRDGRTRLSRGPPSGRTADAGAGQSDVGGDGRLSHLLAHPRPGRRAHPPGGVDRGRADCLSDFEASGAVELHGDVARYRPPGERWKATGLLELGRIRTAVARARESSGRPPRRATSRSTFDATLLNVHLKNRRLDLHTSGASAFHPLGAWCDTTAEPLGRCFARQCRRQRAETTSSCWTRCSPPSF